VEKQAMHELSIMSSILDIVVDYAKRNKVTKVNKINLEVGEFSDLLPDWMQHYFDFVSKDTVADKAELVIDKIPALLKCRTCGNEFTVNRDKLEFICTKCNSADLEILRGREFKIISIEVD
jgi:hydrogenase nickel incorporation protein HypA/HybF